MSGQREKPLPPAAKAWLEEKLKTLGGHASGGRIENFREGWATTFHGSTKAHYFVRRELEMARSICELLATPAGRLFGAGSYPRCKTCERRRRWMDAK